MNEWFIEIEADSLEEARRKLYTEDRIVLRESILCRGELETVESISSTVEEASKKAKSRIPEGAKIKSQEVKVAPKRVVLLVEGDSEESAGNGKAELIESVSLHKKGRKGFLGFGKTPNVYEVVVAQQAVVEVRFREKTRILGKVRSYLAEDLLQSIQELRQRNAPWAEILQILNPQNDPEIRALLLKLRELNPPSELDAIESVCRENEKANWKMAINEACRQAAIARAEIEAEIRRREEAIREAQRQAAIARARELREREIKLRKLDHQIAEDLMIYVCIFWDKHYSKLTGIPRLDWDARHPPDEHDRETIPHYSSDAAAFCKLLNQVEALISLYTQVLKDEGLSEATASLEQKCLALLEAQRRRRKK